MGSSTAEDTERCYAGYYAREGADRNDILKNPGVLFQMLAAEAALIRALSFIGYLPQKHSVADVGGGSGGSLVPFLSLGAPASNLTCIDIIQDRIDEGAKRLPGVRFLCGDARELLPGLGRFDIVWASTIFVQMTDDTLAHGVASAMRRAVKPGGHIIVRDWSFPRPGNAGYRPMNKARLRRLFSGPDGEAVLVRTFRSALVPPLGRALSAWCPALYFPVAAMFPFLAAQKVYVLKA